MKRFIMILAILSFLLCSCGKKESLESTSVKEESVISSEETESVIVLTTEADPEQSSITVITPTGYPADQVQNSCVFYNGVLWFQGWGSQLTSAMKEVGKVESVDNYHLPTSDFASSHLKVGDKIFVLEDDGKVRLFVQRTDVNRVEEFYFIEEESTSSTK